MADGGAGAGRGRGRGRQAISTPRRRRRRSFSQSRSRTPPGAPLQLPVSRDREAREGGVRLRGRPPPPPASWGRPLGSMQARPPRTSSPPPASRPTFAAGGLPAPPSPPPPPTPPGPPRDLPVWGVPARGSRTGDHINELRRRMKRKGLPLGSERARRRRIEDVFPPESSILEAAARPLLSSYVGRRPFDGTSYSAAAASAAQPGPPSLLGDLQEGVYFMVTTFLDTSALCAVDAVSKQQRVMNSGKCGRWRSLGMEVFHGTELDAAFEEVEPHQLSRGSASEGSLKRSRFDWKGRYARYRAELPTFRAPFVGSEINNVTHPDEVAYCACRLRNDRLAASNEAGVYIEVEVNRNPDNLSLAVVDFEDGGRSSVTFSPDTGAVIRERKVRELPRKVQGAYIQPLATTPPGRRFEGSIGLYMRNGHLAFFRKCVVRGSGDAQPEVGPWECTGFVIDMSWTEGQRLTPCLAFRDEGVYRVRIVKVSSVPPQMPERSRLAFEASNWSSLDWEAGQPADDATMA
eukprot:TRINITY_DN15317_c0_g1_i3.p1 TRINITY_DN15317_c0_g1~~TRINITY_DN15317_c0_g1_i3.p1  ORF type:complete len:519 (-),score=91.24 TRINITY_DN15317_c0_g1_i3:53-1609(-)